MSTRRAVLWASLGKMLGFITAFISSIIIARFFLGPADVGLFSMAFAATALIAVLQEFGLNRYIVGEAELDERKLRTAFSVSILVAWGVALLIIILAWPVTWFYGDPRLLPLMLVIGASYLFVPFAIVPTAMLHRRMDFQSDFMIETSAAIANAATSLAFAAMGWGAMSLALGALAQQMARALVSQWRSGWMFPWPFRFKGAGPLLHFGGGSTVLLIFDSVGARAPDLIVGGVLGSFGVGIYSRASGLAVQIIYLMTGAVNSVFYPALARLRDEGKPLGPAYIDLVRGYTGFVFPAMAGLAVSTYPLVLALYGERWIEVAPMLSLLAIAQMIVVALPMPVQIPILLGHLRAVILRSGLAITVLLILFAFGTQWGLWGAAMAYIGYTMTNAVLYGHLMHRLIAFSWKDLVTAYAHSLICTAFAILPLMLAYRFWVPAQHMSFGQLLLAVFGGVISWVIAVYVLHHPVKSELQKIFGDIQQRLLLRAA